MGGPCLVKSFEGHNMHVQDKQVVRCDPEIYGMTWLKLPYQFQIGLAKFLEVVVKSL